MADEGLAASSDFVFMMRLAASQSPFLAGFQKFFDMTIASRGYLGQGQRVVVHGYSRVPEERWVVLSHVILALRPFEK
jgi:hypothetical protein